MIEISSTQASLTANNQLVLGIANWLRWFMYIDTDVFLYNKTRTRLDRIKINSYRIFVTLTIITHGIRMILLDLAKDDEGRHQLGGFYV